MTVTVKPSTSRRPPSPLPPSTPSYGPPYSVAGSAWGNAGNASTGCTMDGLPADCGMVTHFLTDGLGTRSVGDTSFLPPPNGAGDVRDPMRVFLQNGNL